MRNIWEALRRLDHRRTDYWMCRRDTDPIGEWTMCLDPYLNDWDWRVNIGSNNVRAVRRIINATKCKVITDNLQTARQIVDKMRTQTHGPA